MTYSGSTQNSSYSKRTYNKKDANDLAALAKAMDKQRKETVTEFKQASTDQLGELDRQDKIQYSNDQFQIKQLAKFSDNLNSFLKESVESVGKAYIDNKRQEGIELERKYRSGDEEAKSIIDGNTAQLKEIEEQVNSMSQEINESVDAFLSRKAEEEISLKDKIRALNVKKLGPNIRWGFVRAQLQEAGQGYSSHLIDTLQNSKEQFTTRDGSEYTIGKYSEILNPDHKKEIEDYVEDQYIANNNPFGASDVVRNAYLTAKVVETTDKYREKEYIKERAQLGEQQQTGRVDTLITSSIDFDADKFVTVTLADGQTVKENRTIIALDGSIQNLLTEGPSSEAMVNDNVSPYKANKTRVIEAIKEAYSFLDSDTAAELTEHLLKKKFKMAGMEGTLETLMAGDLNLKEILSEHGSKVALQNERLRKSLLSDFNTEYNGYLSEYRKGKLSIQEVRDQAKIIKASGTYDLIFDEKDFQTKLISLEQFNPAHFNYTDSMGKADDIMEERGFLSSADMLQLHPEALKEIMEDANGKKERFVYKENLIWAKMGKSNFDTLLDTTLEPINGTIDSIVKETGIDLTDEIAMDAIKDATRTYLLRKANLYYLNGSSGAKSLQQAAIEVGTELQAGTGIFARDGEKFTDIRMQPPTIAGGQDIETQLLEGAIVTNKLDILQASGKQEDFLATKVLIPAGSKLLEPEVGEDGVIRKLPNALFEIAEYSETGYTAIDVLNLQRKINKLEPYKLSEFSPELQALHNKVKNEYPHLAKVFNSSSEGTSRAIDEMGAVDLNTLTNSVIVNIESPIFEGDLDQVLTRFGYEKDKYDNSALIQEEVRRKQVNYLLKTALQTTKDKNQAILMVATGMRFGEGSMNDYGEGSIYDNISNQKSDYAYSVLDAYYSGDTSKLIGTYSSDTLVTGQFRDLTKTEAKYNLEPNYVMENIVGNVKNINLRDTAKNKAVLEILNNKQFIPPKDLVVPSAGLYGRSVIRNPLYDTYKQALKIYTDIDNLTTKISKQDTSILNSKKEYFNLQKLLQFQESHDLGGKYVPITDSKFFVYRDEWMEKNGSKYQGANKNKVKQLNKQRMEYILLKSKEYLGLGE